MINNFWTKLERLLENPCNPEFRLDSACALVCREVGAASVSILIYSGNDDRLKCEGRYIDPVAGRVDVNNNGFLGDVVYKICAREYIYGLKDKLTGETAEGLYYDFNKKILEENYISLSDFKDLVESFEDWIEDFKKLKDAYRHECFSVSVESKTVTGDWYKKVLYDEKYIYHDLHTKSLEDIDDQKKKLCLNYLREELKLTFSAHYYIAFPLRINQRNSGVLRILSPGGGGQIANSDGTIVLESSYKNLLKEIARNLSLHLELDKFIGAQKGSILTTRKVGQGIEGVEGYLSNRCDLFSEIVHCKGAIIIFQNREKDTFKISGCSKGLLDYRNKIETGHLSFLSQIVKRFSISQSVLCIYFNCTEVPLKLNEYTYIEKKRTFDCIKTTPDIAGMQTREWAMGPACKEIPNVAVFPFPQYPDHFMIFYNPKNRRFGNEDIGMLLPALQTFGMELRERNHHLETKERMSIVRQMHQNINGITRVKYRRSFDSIDDFLKEISQSVEKLKVFSHHIIWECISDEIPGIFSIEENFVLRDVTKTEQRTIPLKRINGFDYPKDKYYRIQLNKREFTETFCDYFESGKLEKKIEIPIKEGFSYFNLPVFSENEQVPQWILTLIFRNEDSSIIEEPDFFEFIEHFAYQVGLAWEKFQENVAVQLLDYIDNKLGGKEITKNHSTLDQLKIISGLLAKDNKADWCAFFLAVEQANALVMEAANIELESPFNFPLSSSSDVIVDSFNGNNIFRLLGRERLEEILKPEKMKPIEKAIRAEKKKRRLRKGKRHFTPYVLFEHALVCPISLGAKKLGVIALFRSKNVQRNQTQDTSRYKTYPFSQYETNLLKKVQRHVFNIFVSHSAVQRRMRDVRNVISQVISPISESISASEKSLRGDDSPENVYDKLMYVHALSRIAAQYVRNFEILLDIDTRKIELRREKILDLRKYLINFSRLYTPVIRLKCIHINVTPETSSNISLEVDRDLLDVVFSNIFDNAVKYSFDPEDRLMHGLQAKPASMDDIENVLITAWENDQSVYITISSCGDEIKESERKRIFDRELRGPHAKDRGKGTGIGLFLSQEILKKHDGKLELVSNTPAHNSVFKIILPKKGIDRFRRV